MLSGLRRVWRECEVVKWFLVKVASPDKQEEHKTTSPLKKNARVRIISRCRVRIWRDDSEIT